MATVALAFGELLQRLELNPTRRALASQRYNAVKDVIESQIPGATLRQIGSFQRKTKIRPVDMSDDLDVDAVVVLGDARSFSSGGSTSPQVLSRVRNALRSSDIYRSMGPQTDAPTVVLEYADRFRMEIAAGYRDLTGLRSRPNGPPCYLVAGPDDDWIPADYDYDSQMIAALNQGLTDGALVPTIKILKHLIRSREIPLCSFHIEILAALSLPQMIYGWNQRGLRWGIEHAVCQTLTDAGGLIGTRVALPGSFSPGVDSGLDTNEREMAGQYLYELGKAAWQACKAGDDQGVLSAWREVVGDPFPALSGLL